METKKGRLFGCVMASWSLSALFAVSAAEEYTWGNARGTWDGTTANWTVGGTTSAWVDSEDNPNNATFSTSEATAAGSAVNVEVTGVKHVNTLTVGGGAPNYVFSGDTIFVKNKLSIWTQAKFTNPVAPADNAGGLVIGGNKMVYMLGAGTGWTGGLTLDLSNFLVLDHDYQLGAEPAEVETNIVVTAASAGIFAQGAFTIHSNRTTRIADTKGLRLGAGNGQRLIVKGLIVSDHSPGCDFNTNTTVTVYDGWKGWSGTTVLDPGAGRTNVFGRLVMNGHMKLSSGVNRLGTDKWGSGTSALANVVNVKTTAFDDSWGHLEIDGGELYSSQSGRIVDVNSYGQVTVKNGGSVYLPNMEWINGLSSPARLTVDDGGMFTVNYLRLTQSDQASEVYLNEGGTLAAKRLYLDSTGRSCNFYFNGGTLKAASADNIKKDYPLTWDYTNDKWSGTTFYIGEKGARFDVTSGNYIWWGRPLVSGAEQDGGLTMIGTGTNAFVVLMAPCTYNGPTVVDGCKVSVRVDYGLPEGTDLTLANGGIVYFHTADNANPQRTTTNVLARVSGDGTLYNTQTLSITNGLAPAAGGTICLRRTCAALTGDFVVSGTATTCSRLELADDSARQDISGLTLRVADFTTFDRQVALDGGYRILDAPNGYEGQFQLPSDWPKDEWTIKYTDDGAILRRRLGLSIRFR